MIYQRHDIEEIEGIGVSRTASMRSIGLTTTEDLLSASELRLKRMLDKIERFPVSRVREFLAHATFMQVTGLDGQHAEALYLAGRRTLTRLAAPDPSVIVRELDQAVEEGTIPEGIDIATATRWQKRALVINYTGTVTGIIESEGNPIDGATVYYEQEQAVTNGTGKFWLPAVPFGTAKLVIKAKGYKRLVRKIKVSVDSLPLHNFTLTSGQDEEQIVNEMEGNAIRTFDADDKMVFYDAELEELPEGAPLQFRHRYRNGNVRLIGVYRRRHNNLIEIPRVIVSGTLIDEGAVQGNVYYWKSGTLKKSTDTVTSLRDKLLLDKFKESGIELVLAGGVSL
ncbi:MAG: DUF4332 domain-containing protein [Spirochaetes bacterium]|nr:DUF4332 domain-containing protein [Spirochaetota bacterium]